MLELQRNIQILRRWWWLLLVAALVGGGVAFGLTKLLVEQRYEGTAVISLAPPPSGPNGLYVTTLSAGADAQLVATRSTADAARNLLPPGIARGIDLDKLTSSIAGTSSIEGQLLFVKAQWPDQALASVLTNAVARAFINLEKHRLESRYTIIHHGLTAKQYDLAKLAASTPGSGPAQSWLQAQYADAESKIIQQDADARIQASVQEASLQIAQTSTNVIKVGPKATTNAVLGGILALLVAFVFAFLSSPRFDEDEGARSLHPVLAKVSD